MIEEIKELVFEAQNLPKIPLKGINEYHQKSTEMTEYVDRKLESIPTINEIIGNNPLQVMYDNHMHHHAFMTTVFIVGNYELLAKTVPWVYRSYSQHSFSFDYFELELNAWLEAVDNFIETRLSQEIKSVYQWMLDRHNKMIELSEFEQKLDLPISAEWLERKNAFLHFILEGDHRACLKIAEDSISSPKDIEDFYLHIIQPAMYEVGMLWERAEISVANEHLASAIVGRVMASVSMMCDMQNTEKKGKAVITSAPNEFHEIGAWMISDVLEGAGWRVRYLGANTPTEDLIKLLDEFKPDLLAMSVTMPFNILKSKETIKAVRSTPGMNGINILVGGRAFNEIENLWETTGADGYATNLDEAKKISEQWAVN